MPDPVKLTLTTQGATWVLTRDGSPLGNYSHLDQATHQAVRLARELDETGAPAQVFVQAANGELIQIDVDPEVTRDEEVSGPAIAQG